MKERVDTLRSNWVEYQNDHATSIVSTFPDWDSMDEEGRKKWQNKMNTIKKKMTKLRKRKDAISNIFYTASTKDQGKYQEELEEVQKLLEKQAGYKQAMLDQRWRNKPKNTNNTSDVGNMADVAEADAIPDLGQPTTAATPQP